MIKALEQSFGDQNQKTAQFFNPDQPKLKIPQNKKKRENSMPACDFMSIISKPTLLSKQLAQRRTTLYQNTIKMKQKTLESTQDSLNQLFSQVNNKVRHSNSSYIVPKQYKTITNQKENLNYETRESRINSRCSVVSAGGDKKRKIKVNDPYGLFKEVEKSCSTKQFLKQKAQNKLVDRIFSSRSDSIQGF